jgi:hypothetical protein
VKKVERREPILGEPLPVYRDMVLLEDSDEKSEVALVVTLYSTYRTPFVYFCHEI